MMQVVGLATLPLCLTLFGRLPDRGYALSKAFALIIVGYLLWILNVAHILPNTSAGIWIILLVLFGISALVFSQRRNDLLGFAREHWWLIAATEIVLFLSFITAVYLRSYVGDLGGTEKPMDFMFLNAVTRANHFPPADPWMSGEKVAYYYFGYLIVSIMTRLSGLQTSVGFNLGVAMTASLAVVGAFGLVYNMIAPRAQRELEAGPGTPAAGFSNRVLWRPIIFGVIAAFLLAVIGNLEGILEALTAHGIGGSGFWGWVHIQGLVPYHSLSWYPNTDGAPPGFWSWWRATRILDNSTGIHEFPFFSFLLGDLHPHVMSIPFVLLALGLAQLLLRYEGPLDLVVWLERPLWLVAFAIMIGGLAFINTWDLPTMAFMIAIAALVRNRLYADRWSWGLVADTAGFFLPLFFCALLAYTPFFFGGFDSQASGFKAVSNSGTRLFQALMLWSVFAVIVLPYALWRLLRTGRPTLEEAGWALAPMALILLLWLSWEAFAGNTVKASFGINNLLGWLPLPMRPIDLHADISLGDRIGARGWSWLTFLVMGGAVALIGLAFYREVEDAKRTGEDRFGHIFALALSGTAALLILGSEFFFILDTFDGRMNTIFKLYYQAWLMLSVAGGFVLYEITQGFRMPSLRVARTSTAPISLRGVSVGEIVVGAATLTGAVLGLALGQDGLTRIVGFVVGAGVFFVVSGASFLWWQGVPSEGENPHVAARVTWRGVWAGAAATVLFAAFLYPVLATYNRTNGFSNPRMLDGQQNLASDQKAVIAFLRGQRGHPVVVEAPGGDYTDFGTISASTALPTIIQWRGHEVQWRGSSKGLDDQLNAREQALQAIYAGNSDEAANAIRQYNVRFVVVGPREHEKYPNISIDQLTGVVQPVKQEGEYTVYRVQPDILSK
jgi:YYY domain-containing protein